MTGDLPFMSLEHAIRIACVAHAGQTDKAGQPYILHPLRVMLAMADDFERTTAVLHDVLEPAFRPILEQMVEVEGRRMHRINGAGRLAGPT